MYSRSIRFHSFLGLGLFCAASCWMLYLAWKIWPRGRNAFLAGCGDIPPASCIYRDALVTNLMNPKATFFFVALSAPLLEKIMILPMLFLSVF